MSQDDVELVRSIYGQWNSLYESGVPLRPIPDELDQQFRDLLDEQFEVRLPPDYPEGRPVFRGREEFAEFIARISDTWGKWRFELERFLEAYDSVVVFLRILAEGGASGVPVEFETTHVWTIRDGRATSMHAYRKRSQALEAAGLSE